MTAAADVGTDTGLRHALGAVRAARTWNIPAGRQLLAEIRRKAVRHAARIGNATGERCDRNLVDDVVCAAWAVLDRWPNHVLGGDRPWAYLMSAASRRVCGEIRAGRQVTSTAGSERATAGGYAPQVVVRVGCSATDVATAFSHEHPKDSTRRDWRTLGRRSRPYVIDERTTTPSGAHRTSCKGWYDAFVRILVAYGADETVTIRAVDHLSNMFMHTKRKSWETVARRDPVLARLGLSADQCGALVGLLAGSRRERANGQIDSLLVAVRHAEQAGMPVELSMAQRRRLAVYAGHTGTPTGDAAAAANNPALAAA